MRQSINPKDFLILVVDDLASNLKVLRGILEPIGYDLTFATSGKQTLERIKLTKPDLILLDLMMPDMDGLQVCQAIYSSPMYQDIPIIFLTASQEQKHLIEAFEQGAVDYITKPCNKHELLSRIRSHLELKYYRDILQRQLVQERLITQITTNILINCDLNQILEHSVAGIGSLLRADRVAIGRFISEEKCEIIAENISGDCPSLLGSYIIDYAKFQLRLDLHRAEEIQIINQISECGTLVTEELNRLCDHQVKAEFIIPLLQQKKLWGIVIVDYCRSSHTLKDGELTLLTQLIHHTEVAIQQSELLQKLQIANEQLERLAHVDSLTQIPNRRQFDICIKQEWFRLRREQLPLSLILCDVDHFKQYNDLYGHQAGDTCLREVAQAMAKTVQRPADLVARYGGEEFAVILPNTDFNGAIFVAEMIQKSVVQKKILHQGSSAAQYVTLSMGISSMIPSLNLSFTQLIAQADQALYEAKARGRNQFFVYQPLQYCSVNSCWLGQ